MPKGDLELRNTPATVEFRATPDGAGLGVLAGYAAVFESRSQNLGGFVEVVSRSAFTKTLNDGGRVVARLNHDDSALLGTSDAGTLRTFVDERGLGYEVDLPDTTAGRDVAVLAARGDLRFSSFAFRTVSDDWDVTETGMPERRLLEVQLVDVAPVVTPAYMDSSTGMRSLAGRLGLTVDEVAVKEVTEIRALRAGDEPPAPPVIEENDAPRDTHALDLQRRRLELERKK